jgi:hypothetical protein
MFDKKVSVFIYIRELASESPLNWAFLICDKVPFPIPRLALASNWSLTTSTTTCNI